MIIDKNIQLSDFTTFRTGGTADFFCRVSTVEDLKIVRDFIQKNNILFFVLGGGSNVLISDEGFRGLVIKNEIKKELVCEAGEVTMNSTVLVSAGSGNDWDGFVGETISRGWFGLENLSHIPGTVGAAPVQNVGAYGVEAGSLVEWVEIFDMETGEIKKISAQECGFGYRDSIFKRSQNKKLIITQVCFRLSLKPDVHIEYKDLTEYFTAKNITDITPVQVRAAIIEIRTKKLPDWKIMGTAGSFFKNCFITKEKYESLKEQYPGIPGFTGADGLVKVPLAWVLDHVCNLKGYRHEGVGVYENQSLVLVNYAMKNASEVRELASLIVMKVKEKTGIEIEPEVEYVGF
ncbi:MAG: UDP-N-acetylmuramate dehydrogenase [Candidatus Paceibacterota bacterium]|jgi:UDP-N-acetylmuramate dehydrogenase